MLLTSFPYVDTVERQSGRLCNKAMANMLMDGDFVSVRYQSNQKHFFGVVVCASGRRVQVQHPVEVPGVVDFTCVDGEWYRDPGGQRARIFAKQEKRA